MTCSDRRPIRPISSATGNEHVGPDDAGQRVVPAREHLEADDLAGREVHLRLEIGNELAVLEAEADALLDLALGDQRALHAGVEPDRPRDAAAARMVHGDVGAAQEVGDAGVGRRRRGDAGEGADLDDPLLEQERPGDRREAPPRRASSARPISSAVERQRDGELVAAEARDAPHPAPSSSAKRAGDASSAAGRRSHSRAGR